MKKIVILISPTGKGTNLKAILEAIKDKRVNASVETVISETESAPGCRIAREFKSNIDIIKDKDDLLEILSKYEPEYIVLCGWKQIIPETVLTRYTNRILNIHPGIIPDKLDNPYLNPDHTAALWNKGLYADQAIGNFLKNKASYAGSSVHFLSEDFDFGVVLGRIFEKIRTDDTIESLYSRIKVKENNLYIKVLGELCK